MCMEDIRVMRRSVATVGKVTVAGTAVVLVSANPKRVALVVSAPDVDGITISPDRAVQFTEGITLHPRGDPLVLDLQHHGALVTNGWWIICSGGPEVIGYAETLLSEV